jgi:hypothetical protein
VGGTADGLLPPVVARARREAAGRFGWSHRSVGAPGPALGRPAVDTITGSSNLKELRAKGSGAELRVLFNFDPIQRAVLLVGGDKSGLWNRWYDTAIVEAERVYERYLASRQNRREKDEYEAGGDNG